MFKTKSFLSFLSITLIISACGEPFKSGLHGDLTGFGNSWRSFWTHDPTIDGDMDADKNVLYDYRTELEGKENKTILLSRKIKAFDFSLSKVSGTESGLKARITLSCDSLLDYRKKVNSSDLHSTEVINLGTKENYNLQVECTNTDCSQMVAAIRDRSPGESATVLVGLTTDKKFGEALIYTTRSVAYTPYFQTFYSYEHYNHKNNCSTTGNNNDSFHQIVDFIDRNIPDEWRDEAEDEMGDFIEDLF